MSVETGDGDTVFKATNGGHTGVIHDDEDCHRLDRAQNVVEKPASAFPDWYNRCAECFEGEE